MVFKVQFTILKSRHPACPERTGDSLAARCRETDSQDGCRYIIRVIREIRGQVLPGQAGRLPYFFRASHQGQMTSTVNKNPATRFKAGFCGSRRPCASSAPSSKPLANPPK